MKKVLRKELLNLRKEKDNLYISTHSKIIVDKIVNSVEFKNAKKIGIYYPIKNEVDLLELLNYGKEIYFPRIYDLDMKFHLVNNTLELVTGPFNTLEPNINSKVIDKSDLDIIYIPCVGISNSLYRIGYGKGFYDRYLNDFFGLKIAVAFNFQVIDFESEDHDVLLDKLITD